MSKLLCDSSKGFIKDFTAFKKTFCGTTKKCKNKKLSVGIVLIHA